MGRTDSRVGGGSDVWMYRHSEYPKHPTMMKAKKTITEKYVLFLYINCKAYDI